VQIRHLFVTRFNLSKLPDVFLYHVTQIKTIDVANDVALPFIYNPPLLFLSQVPTMFVVSLCTD
jgi:hypothetical protein